MLPAFPLPYPHPEPPPRCCIIKGHYSWGTFAEASFPGPGLGGGEGGAVWGGAWHPDQTQVAVGLQLLVCHLLPLYTHLPPACVVQACLRLQVGEAEQEEGGGWVQFRRASRRTEPVTAFACKQPSIWFLIPPKAGRRPLPHSPVISWVMRSF